MVIVKFKGLNTKNQHSTDLNEIMLIFSKATVFIISKV